MADFSVKKIDELEAIYHGSFKRARAELGVESFGMQIFDMPPSADFYPEHNHEHDGQEEVYIALSGSAEIVIDGESFALDADTIVRVGPDTTRKIIPGDQGIRILAIGGMPGKVYTPPEFTVLGTPEPAPTAG